MHWRVVLATLLIVPPALGVLGTFLYDVPYVGLATAYVPWYWPWLIVVTVAGAGIAIYGWFRRRSRFSAALVVLAAVTLVGASVIVARMTASVEQAGADIDLLDTFGIGETKWASPDAEVMYTTFDGEPLGLNIYRPNTPSRAPVLVYIHGGGWIGGDRSAHGADLRWFADQGWLTIGVDYALSSNERHLWDVTQDQIGCALAWIADNAGTYGGDPSRLSVSGDSAGGNLAINTAYMAANGTLKSSCGGRLPPVRAVSALYPVVDPAGFFSNDAPTLAGTSRGMADAYTGGSPQQFPDRYAAISSETHISAAAPPTLIIVGEADHLVPVEGTYRFSERARRAGVDVELVAVPYADHVFDARRGSIGQQAYRQLTARWLRAHGQAP
ncbi:alpha/beta hydrolase [Mycobacterium sp. MMS18-G62]